MKLAVGKIRDGVVDWITPKWKRKQVMEQNDGRMVTISVAKPKRSQQQNNFYWMYLSLIESETGNVASDLHEYCKRKFLRPVFITINGESVKVANTTTGLSKNDFSDYLDKISAWSEVPVPDVDTWIYGD